MQQGPYNPRANSLRCSARFLTKSHQPTCARDVVIHHPDTCSLTLATEAVSPLPGPTDERKQEQDEHSKVLTETPQKKIWQHMNKKKEEEEKKVSSKGEPLTDTQGKQTNAWK